MQSVSTKIRPFLTGSCGWRIQNPAILYSTPNYLFRRPLWIPNRGGTNTKSILARQFSEGGSKNGSSSSANTRQNRSFFQWYSDKLDTDPILTKSISAGIIAAVGSVLGQLITHRQQQKQENVIGNNENNEAKQKPFELDMAHVSNFTLLNIVFVAPVLHYWYLFINRAIPGTSFAQVIQRTICDEGLFSPIYVPSFLSMLWKLEGNTNENIWKMVKNECPTIIVTEWAMWIPTMLVTFKYVPVKFQVLVVNVVGVVWNTYLAYASFNASSEPKNDDAKENATKERNQ